MPTSGEWGADLYDGWDDDRQGLYDSFATMVADSEIDLYADGMVQSYVDVLFGDEPIGGDYWNQIHEALVEYMQAEYDINFDELWDWDTWREMYE